jgi:hypothetical protein
VVESGRQDRRRTAVVLGRSQNHDRVNLPAAVLLADLPDPERRVGGKRGAAKREDQDDEQQVAEPLPPGESRLLRGVAAAGRRRAYRP